MNIPLNTDLLRQLFAAARSWLEIRRETLNNLNIFPVPDGDTGSNMLNTIVSAVKAFDEEAASLPDLFKALIEKSLWGARGNSGVILSNFIKGFFTSLLGAGKNAYSAEDFIRACTAGRDQAYRSTPDPVEGTILSVMSEAALRTKELLGSETTDPVEFFTALTAFLHDAVERTKDQLEVLKNVGVVDSGGCGFYYIAEGITRSLSGKSVDIEAVKDGYIPDAGEGVSGRWEEKPDAKYCLEITLEASDRADEIMKSLQEFGSSEVAVSTDSLLKIHIHTNEPDLAIDRAGLFSNVLDVYKENMVRQQYLMLANRREALDGYPSVVAVVSGEGMKDIYLELGASVVIDGGNTMNPSVEELVGGIEEAGKDNVILLVNNRDTFLSSQEAVKLTGRNVGIIQSTSMMEGIASLMSFAPGVSFDENILHMEKGISTLRDGYITRALTDTPAVRKGEYFSGKNKEVQFSGDLAEVAEKTLESYVDGDSSLLSLYTGKDAGESEIEIITGILKQNYPELDVEVFSGGQPNYLFLFSIE